MKIEFEGLWAIAAIIYTFGSFGTSIVACIKSSQWLLLLAVAVFPPIGCVHGTGVWFGVWS